MRKLKLFGFLITVAATCLSTTASALDDNKASDWAIEGYIGQRLSGDYDYGENGLFDENFQIDAGQFYGGSVWYTGLAKNVEIGIDFNTSSATEEFGFEFDATTIMVVGRVSHSFNEIFDIYAGAGLGLVRTNLDFRTEASTASNLGGQVSIGARANISDNMAVFVEVKHQRSFSNPTQVDRFAEYEYEYKTNNALVGFRLQF